MIVYLAMACLRDRASNSILSPGIETPQLYRLPAEKSIALTQICWEGISHLYRNVVGVFLDVTIVLPV